MSTTNLRRQLVASLASLGGDLDAAIDLASVLKLAGTELLMSAGALFDRAADIEEHRSVGKAQIIIAKAALAHATKAIAEFEKCFNRD